MKIAMIGLGRMGMNMVKRVLAKKHEVAVFNRTFKKSLEVAECGAQPYEFLEDLIDTLPSPKICWIMLPAGEVTEKMLETVSSLLNRGDIIIDGGNAYYKDSIAHEKYLAKKKIEFLDIGVSGGIWGFAKGYCLMVGGKRKVFNLVEPIFKALGGEEGYDLVGSSGSGHFTKMIHNGIEYAMMQAISEGFEIMQKKSEFDLNLASIAKLWNRGSVVRSWLLELTESIFSKNPNLTGVSDYVGESGEGRWAVQEAINLSVPAETIAISLMKRFRSQQKSSFAAKLLASLRNEFGGHQVFKE